MSIFFGMPLLAQKRVNDNTFEIGTQKPDFDDEYCKVAALFATEAIKTIGNEPFDALEKRISKEDETLRIKQLERLKEPLRVKYDYSKIPIDVKRKIYKHLSGEHFMEDELQDEAKESKSFLANLVYLSWLWVNGFVTEYRISIGNRYSYYAEVDDRFDFDYDVYDGLNETGVGSNIYETYYYHFGLDKVSHLLKVQP